LTKKFIITAGTLTGNSCAKAIVNAREHQTKKIIQVSVGIYD
jgi:hypothetical protein